MGNVRTVGHRFFMYLVELHTFIFSILNNMSVFRWIWTTFLGTDSN
jgi:hypothetical protein